MPKLKTHKATSRRMQYSGSGKLMRTRLWARAICVANKTKRTARQFDEMFLVSPAGCDPDQATDPPTQK